MKADQYDGIAEEYEQYSNQNAYNMLCERPATLSLIGDLHGKTVLDAACGPGFYASFCEQHGANKVFAFDGSPNMVELARENVSHATLFVHDLETPLTTIPAGTLDGIICGLALSYIQDLNRCLHGFSRVLTSRGFLIFSIENPWLVYRRFGTRYWEQELVEHTSTRFSNGVQGSRRPLAMYLNSLHENGFSLERIVEAQPVDRCKDLFPEIYQKMVEIPYFLAVRAQKVQ